MYTGQSQLPVEVVKFYSSSGTNKIPYILGHVSSQPVRPGATFYADSDDYHMLTIPHNLKLIHQEISVSINVNGQYDQVKL